MLEPCSDAKNLDKLKIFTRTPKILLVEDDRIVQRVHIEFLTILECSADLAKDGIEALKMFQGNYDLIFMDVGLPDLSGLESSSLIRHRERNSRNRVPIIAFTGFGELDKRDCDWAGIDEVVVKPAPLEELLTVLKRHLPHLLKTN